MTTNEKIQNLRKEMEKAGMDTYFVLSQDAHQSEYVAPYWRERAYISGFTGSAGTFAATKDESAVWVDGRYFLQGEEQVKGTEVQLMKMGEPGVPTVEDWLLDHTKEGGKIGVDGRSLGHAAALQLKEKLSKKQIELLVNEDLVGKVWTDRPTLPKDPIFDFPAEFSGETREERIERVRKHLQEVEADYYLEASLESSCWLLNFRGNDIPCTPVAYCFTLIGKDFCDLFIDEDKVQEDMKEKLLKGGVSVRSYHSVPERMASLPAGKVALDLRLINQQLFEGIPESWTVLNENDCIIKMKAVKTPVEQENMRKAHIKDGAVMIRFLKWVKEEVKKGVVMDEVDAATYLDNLRKSQENSLGISFGTIAGYGPNGAIVHYGPVKETCATLKPEGFLLVDSGAQYLEGTTDITRTIALGPLTEEMKEAYTLVLKGHLALGHARYKRGITGSHLDILARKPLWDHNLDYKHGTGHGVGFVLSVHEGPQNISNRINNVVIEPGMIISDEPGYYPTGKFGVRIENLVMAIAGEENEWGQFDYLESLTLCPYEREAIVKEMLTQEEIEQINAYHERVFKEVAPLVQDDPEVLAFLKEQTAEI